MSKFKRVAAGVVWLLVGVVVFRWLGQELGMGGIALGFVVFAGGPWLLRRWLRGRSPPPRR